jgi:hypothetical protein
MARYCVCISLKERCLGFSSYLTDNSVSITATSRISTAVFAGRVLCWNLNGIGSYRQLLVKIPPTKFQENPFVWSRILKTIPKHASTLCDLRNPPFPARPMFCRRKLTAWLCSIYDGLVIGANMHQKCTNKSSCCSHLDKTIQLFLRAIYTDLSIFQSPVHSVHHSRHSFHLQ